MGSSSMVGRHHLCEESHTVWRSTSIRSAGPKEGAHQYGEPWLDWRILPRWRSPTPMKIWPMWGSVVLGFSGWSKESDNLPVSMTDLVCQAYPKIQKWSCRNTFFWDFQSVFQSKGISLDILLNRHLEPSIYLSSEWNLWSIWCSSITDIDTVRALYPLAFTTRAFQIFL